jgi:hypothetical protein
MYRAAVRYNALEAALEESTRSGIGILSVDLHSFGLCALASQMFCSGFILFKQLGLTDKYLNDFADLRSAGVRRAGMGEFRKRQEPTSVPSKQAQVELPQRRDNPDMSFFFDGSQTTV